MRTERHHAVSLGCPQAVLFDIGMTLIFPDGEVIAREISRLAPGSDIGPAEAARALAVAAEAHHLNVGGTLSDAELVGFVMGHVLGLAPSVGIEAWRALTACDDLYSILDPHSIPVLQKLNRSGVKTAAVSNALNCVHEELAAFGLLQHFDIVIGSSDGYHDKPEPGMFEAALSKLDTDPSDAWHVGDGLINDVLGASRARVGDQILVDRYGIYAKPPCPTVESMRDLLELVTQLCRYS